MRESATLLAPGRQGRGHGPGRSAHGVRQAHRPLPALHRAGAAPGAHRRRPRRRPGAAHRVPVLQPLQARGHGARREAGRRGAGPQPGAERRPGSRRRSPASSSARASSSTATTRGSAGSWRRWRTSRSVREELSRADHPHPAADHAGRRRHRPAVVLPGARRHGRLRGHHPAHLHLDQPHVHRRLLPQVQPARAGRQARPDRAPDRPRGAARPRRRPQRRDRLHRRHPVRHRPGLVRVVHRRACSRRSTRCSATTSRPSDLGREACEIEIERLGRTVGKQDQYIAAFGGITRFDFNPDGSVDVAAGPAVAATPCTTSSSTC